jgi:hypothetical protein
METPGVAVLADDLIWSTRLVDLVKAAGHRPVTVRTLPDLTRALPDVSAVIVDLTARAYDGIAAVEVANHDGHRVLCVGQHDDQGLRTRALAAGAERVYAYRALFERGPEVLTRWLSGPATAPRGSQAGGDDR